MTSYTDHPDDRALDLYVMGDADSLLRSRVDAHLAQCDACRAREQSLQSLVGAVRNVLAPVPAPHLLNRIHGTHAPRAPSWRRPSRIAAMVLLMVGSAVAVAQVVAYVRRDPVALRPTPPYSGQITDNPQSINAVLQRLGSSDSIPPTRKVGARVAISTDSFETQQTTVRALRDGRAIVVDFRSQTARLYDARLARAIDIGLVSSRMDVPISIAVSPFRGDSSLILSSGSVAADVVDPSGRVVRALPWGEPRLTMPMSTGTGIVSNSGHVIGSMPRTVRITPMQSWIFQPFNSGGDSMLVFRSALGSTQVDTVGYARRPPYVREPDLPSTDSLGRPVGVGRVKPVSTNDEVATFSDGTIAIVRSADYAIDWVDPDGTRRSTPPVAHEWRQLSAADKAALGNDVQKVLMMFPSEYSIRVSASERATGVQTQVVSTSGIPDRLPPFLGSFGYVSFRTLADADGRLWIPQYPAPGSGAAPPIVFDIVDKKGRLIDRVEMPPLTVPVAFAPGLVFAMQWLGQRPGCPHPAPGASALAPVECMNSVGRLVSYRVR
jgi:hypothetical protein